MTAWAAQHGVTLRNKTLQRNPANRCFHLRAPLRGFSKRESQDGSQKHRGK